MSGGPGGADSLQSLMSGAQQQPQPQHKGAEHLPDMVSVPSDIARQGPEAIMKWMQSQPNRSMRKDPPVHGAHLGPDGQPTIDPSATRPQTGPAPATPDMFKHMDPEALRRMLGALQGQ